MKNSGIILILILFILLGCQETKVDYLSLGNEELQEAHKPGTTTSRKEHFKIASEYFKKALEENPNLLDAQLGLYVTYSRIRKDEVFTILDKSIEAQKNALGILLEARGRQNFIQKNYDTAIINFKEALQYSPHKKELYAQITINTVWKKFKKDDGFSEFEEADILNIIDEVFPDNVEKITLEEFNNGIKGGRKGLTDKLKKIKY